MAGDNIKLAKILTVAFNQDNSYFCVGTTCGFRIYSIDPFSEISNSEKFPEESQVSFVGGISQIAILYKTQILALVGSSTNKKLSNQSVLIYDNYQKKKLQERPFISPILNVLMLKDRLVVVLSTGVYVFNLLQGFTVEQHIKTCANPRGACAISSNNDMSVLATLAKEEGELTIHNYFLKAVKGQLVCAIDSTGSYIKVFDVISSGCLYSFKRGMKASIISNASFNTQNSYLGVSSSAGTVHLFSLRAPSVSESAKVDKSLMESGIKFWHDLKSYLPPVISLPSSTARLHLKEQMGCNWAAKEGSLVGPMAVFAKEKNKLFVVTQCGSLFKARLDPHGGKECVVEKRIDWLHGALEIKKKKKDMYNPFTMDLAEEEKGGVIIDYFQEESKNNIIEKPAEGEAKDQSPEQKFPVKTEEKPKKKAELGEWLIVD